MGNSERFTKFSALNEKFFLEISVRSGPHFKYPQVAALYQRMIEESLAAVECTDRAPEVLDMGAGEGALTLPFLACGANVVAADGSAPLLQELSEQAQKHSNQLEIRHGDIFTTVTELAKQGRRFDIICCSSFLHHIPDYLGLCRQAMPLLRKPGAFFTFQDPLRYDGLSRGTYAFDRLSYYGWRLGQGNYWRGFKTRCRRLFGVYRDDLPEDVAEYHVVRSGVDQDALKRLFDEAGLVCEIRPYWSTQGDFFQHAGEKRGLLNTFGLFALRGRNAAAQPVLG